MADFPIGQPVPVGIRIVSPLTGSPVTSGVTTTYSIYGPASATALVAAATATHLGDGIWGDPDEGPYTVAGTYRFVLAGFSATVDGTSRTWGAQEYTFAVGTPDPGALTLRDLLTAMCLPLDDGWVGTTTSAGALNGSTDGTLIDSRLINANGVTDDWMGTEVFPFQYHATTPFTIWSKPYRVKSYTPATGTLTLLPVQPALIASGVDYLACNVNGRGFGVQERLRALRGALRVAGATRRASVEVSTTIAFRTDEYAIPPQLVSLTGVALRYPTDQADRWTPLGPHLLKEAVRADRRLVTLRGWPAGTLVQLTGWAHAVMPPFLAQYVDGPCDWYITRAAADLLKASHLAEHQRMAGPLYQEAIATRPRRTPDANEIVLG